MPPSFAVSLFMSPLDCDLYIQFQTDTGTEDDLGFISYALDYHEFLGWRSKHFPTPDETFRHPKETHVPDCAGQVAGICRHRLHPTDNYVSEYCPVCEVKVCLQFQAAITNAWKAVGGAWPQSIKQEPKSGAWNSTEIQDTRKQYLNLRKAWYIARLEFAHILGEYDSVVDTETRWDERHPEQEEEIRAAYSATKALAVAYAESLYPVVPSKTPAPAQAKSIVKKSVTFAEDTQFEQTRHNLEFCRVHTAYEPGMHACPNEDGWEETSFMRDNMYSLSQYKVARVSLDHVEPNEDGTVSVPRPREFEEIAGLHEYWDYIVDIWGKKLQRTDWAFRTQMENGMAETDALVMEVDKNGGPKGTFFIAVEDHEKERRVEAPNAPLWSSAKECI